MVSPTKNVHYTLLPLGLSYLTYHIHTKNAGNHLLALGPRKAVEKQVTPA